MVALRNSRKSHKETTYFTER